MPVSPDESTLLSLRAPVCSVVFSALTDPSVQLQLVGIRALTVLGSLQGWYLISLGRQREVSPCSGRHGATCLLGHPCLLPVLPVGAQEQCSTSYPGHELQGHLVSWLFVLGTLYLWGLACCCVAASLDKGEGCWPEHWHLWLRAGFRYGSCCRLPVSL